MDESTFSSWKVIIVGLGLMGGSLAVGLKKAGQYLLAIDPDRDTREYALNHKIVDRVFENPAGFITEADVVILSAPVDAILSFIPSLPDLHPGSPILIDLGSTKEQICQAYDRLPDRFQAVGGHPMCGKEVSGLSNADPSIFQDSVFAFSSCKNTTALAKRFAEWLSSLLGANPLWLSPDVHDRWVAATSHLPYLVSSALTLVTSSEVSNLIGPGFLSASRLAGSHPEMMRPVLESNRNNILEALTYFRKQLDEIEGELRSGEGPRLAHILGKARKHRKSLTTRGFDGES